MTTRREAPAIAIEPVDPAGTVPAPAIGWEEYFATTDPPTGIEEAGKRVESFVERHVREGRRVVLVTSGGTTVPLEKNTVRFLDNFSAGTRGATSAEYFIDAGYAVIFMHRQFSLQPYSRHYTHSKNCFLDYMEEREDAGLCVNKEYASQMRLVLRKYHHARDEHLLHMETFVTVQDYLFLLRRFTMAMSPLKENAMYYLAAAVSDFFIPQSKMSEHKIQSATGALLLQLDQVPKVISPLVNTWSHGAFIISFKLETDPALLISKSLRSLNTYNHQAVIGNMLATRKVVVTVVTRDERKEIRLSEEEVKKGVEIEERIVPELVRRHEMWIEEVRKSKVDGA